MAQVETLKIGNTSYGITDANTLPALNATTRAQLLLDGTYLGSAVESGKVFETVNGTFESFTKTPGTPTVSVTKVNIGTRPVAIQSCMCYGNGKYVHVFWDRTTAAYSTNLSTWTTVTLPVKQEYEEAVYAFGKFLFFPCYGDGTGTSNKVLTSTDGVTWTTTTASISTQFKVVCKSDTMVLAGGYTSGTYGQYTYTTDGTTWATGTLPVTSQIYALAYGNGMYLAITASAACYKSTDGINWTAVTAPSNVYANGQLAFVNGVFSYICCQDPGAGGAVFYRYTTTDGSTWTSQTSLDNRILYQYSNGSIILGTSYYNSYVAYTADGINWTNVSVSPTQTYKTRFFTDADNNIYAYDVDYNYSSSSSGVLKAEAVIPYTYSLSPVKNYIENTATGSNALTIAGTPTTSTSSTNIGVGSSAGGYAVALGRNASSQGLGVVIGSGAQANGTGATVLGCEAKAAAGAVQIGAQGNNTEAGTMYVSLSTTGVDSSFTNYKLLQTGGTIPAARLGALPTADGTYTLTLTITDGVPVLSFTST